VTSVGERDGRFGDENLGILAFMWAPPNDRGGLAAV